MVEAAHLLLLGGVGYLIFFIFFFINLGILLDFTNVNAIFSKPIGLGIGIFCNFFLLPLLSYATSCALFSDEYHIQYGLLIVGISTLGVANICWNIVFGGNLDLSITINVINAILAFGSIPLWIKTLGSTIYYNEESSIPFGFLLFETVMIVVGYGLGICMRRMCSASEDFSLIVVKSCSVTYLIGTLSIGIYSSYDVFLYLPGALQLKIALAGFLVPTFGYLITWLLATLFKLDHRDRMTIALGAFNVSAATSIAVYYTMIHPQVEMVSLLNTIVVIMTPLPLSVHYLVYKIKDRAQQKPLDVIG